MNMAPLANQTVFCERACMRERGREGRKIFPTVWFMRLTSSSLHYDTVMDNMESI